MNYLMSLKTILSHLKFKPEEPEKLTRPFTDEQSEELKAAIKAVAAPLIVKPKGRVIKQTRHAEFNPEPNFKGGRIVKVMPRPLQKIKQAQEKFEHDETGPTVEDLEE